jgi:hypothetical protein
LGLEGQLKSLDREQKSLGVSARERETYIEGLERQASFEGKIFSDEDRLKIDQYSEALGKMNQRIRDIKISPITQELEKARPILEGLQEIGINTFHKIGDEIGKFASTGEASLQGFGKVVKSLVDSMINDLVRLVFQTYVTENILKALKPTSTGSPSVLDAVIGGAGVAGGAAGGGAASSGALEGAAGVATVALASRGAIIGMEGSHIQMPTAAFAHATHFQGGGLVGTDTYPAMLTPGEGVFTKEQMRSMAPVQQGGNTYIFQPSIQAQDAVSVRKTMPQLQSEFYRSTERVAARNNTRKR